MKITVEMNGRETQYNSLEELLSETVNKGVLVVKPEDMGAFTRIVFNSLSGNETNVIEWNVFRASGEEILESARDMIVKAKSRAEDKGFRVIDADVPKPLVVVRWVRNGVTNFYAKADGCNHGLAELGQFESPEEFIAEVNLAYHAAIASFYKNNRSRS